MTDFADKLKELPDFIGSDGRSIKAVLDAEEELGVKFADDYRQYLEKIGLASIDGHELTGLTDIERLDVVAVTEKQRALNEDIPSNWYVVEEANIDGIVVWQDNVGRIYQTTPSAHRAFIAPGLLSYFEPTKRNN